MSELEAMVKSVIKVERNGVHYDVGAHCSGLDKPVFTQAMADISELPMIGSDFKVHGDEDCDDGYCYLRCVAHHVEGGVIGQDGSGRIHWIISGAIAIETRTPKQMAVDEMLELDLWATDGEFCEALYDAGYRKC